ncbi:epoxide hydrolase 3-like [Hyposmocoma kahamanoa]|uniref:epoxide hydrolase 3-like n=1 Tax=Hyposmocoma kahamanoa TaxID=1477025 RepID=UPI000E6D7923|nr:epoxide hydrolase 3-like [Hyposmocoma kahamanoa]
MRLPWIAEKLLQMNNLEAFDACFLVRGKNTITKNDVECYKYWFGKQHTLTPPVNYYRANFEYVIPEKKFCELNIPFLAAIPDKDPYLNTSLLDGMKKEYKYIETTVIKECGHCAQQEEPEMINKLIRDFLTKHNL